MFEKKLLRKKRLQLLCYFMTYYENEFKQQNKKQKKVHYPCQSNISNPITRNYSPLCQNCQPLGVIKPGANFTAMVKSREREREGKKCSCLFVCQFP